MTHVTSYLLRTIAVALSTSERVKGARKQSQPNNKYFNSIGITQGHRQHTYSRVVALATACLLIRRECLRLVGALSLSGPCDVDGDGLCSCGDVAQISASCLLCRTLLFVSYTLQFK